MESIDTWLSLSLSLFLNTRGHFFLLLLFFPSPPFFFASQFRVNHLHSLSTTNLLSLICPLPFLSFSLFFSLLNSPLHLPSPLLFFLFLLFPTLLPSSLNSLSFLSPLSNPSSSHIDPHPPRSTLQSPPLFPHPLSPYPSPLPTHSHAHIGRHPTQIHNSLISHSNHSNEYRYSFLLNNIPP